MSMGNPVIVSPAQHEMHHQLLAARVEENTAVLEMNRDTLGKVLGRLRDISKEDIIRIGVGYVVTEYFELRPKLSPMPMQVEELQELVVQAKERIEKAYTDMPKPLKIRLA